MLLITCLVGKLGGETSQMGAVVQRCGVRAWGWAAALPSDDLLGLHQQHQRELPESDGAALAWPCCWTTKHLAVGDQEP